MNFFDNLQRGPFGIVLAIIYAVTFFLPLCIGGYILFNFFRAPKRNQIKTTYQEPETYFAVVISARNEENIIRQTILNLISINYPKSLYRVIVIADNCDDRTAEYATQAGAAVYVRHDKTKMSKAHALNWLFKKTGFLQERYDAICLVDADTILADHFLLEMDREITKGYDIVQGRCGSVNPHDTLISSFMTVLLSVQNRIWLLPQSNINRSGIFVGTGVCITTQWLKSIGWNIKTMVEDAEFGIQSVLVGGFVRYCDQAEFYVEQVRSFKQLWIQQRRWRTGHIECLKLYGRELWINVFRDNNKDALNYLILVMIPPFCISTLFQAIILPILSYLLLGKEALDPLLWGMMFFAQLTVNFVIQFIVLQLDQKFSFKLWKGITAMLFAPLFFGLVDTISILKPKNEWTLIQHDRMSVIKNSKKGTV
jgi:cellulose synthase/poly-beta-1,6-N-acetylglucosamine synthase-like glycosyltransferase